MNLQEVQETSIVRMLQLKTFDGTDEKSFSTLPQWKVLIYDRVCQDIIAPIMKVVFVVKIPNLIFLLGWSIA